MKWGLIGCGHIAKKFIKSINEVEGAEIVIAASRSNAEELAKIHTQFQITDNYEDVYKHPDVEVVYVNTTHNFHFQNVTDALRAGKHVLCEKSLGIHPDEVKQMIDLSQKNKLFLMEAMWTRFLPAYNRMIDIVRSGTIGDIKYIGADFCFDGRQWMTPESRLINPALAGGAIWDVGIYPLAMIIDIYGVAPEGINCFGILAESGVDQRAIVNLDFGQGKFGHLLCGFDIGTAHDAAIFGQEGYIKMADFWHGEYLETMINGEKERIKIPLDIPTAFSYQIKASEEAIANNDIQHLRMSHQHSIIISEIMEDCLQQLKASNKS